MTKYTLNPPEEPRSVAVGYDSTTDEFYGYAFSFEHTRPILADRREPTIGGRAAASSVIDAVRPWVLTVPPGLADTLNAERDAAGRSTGEKLRAALIDADGDLTERTHPVIGNDKLTIMRTHVQGNIELVNLGNGLDAWLNEESLYVMEPNIYGSRVLWDLGAPRQMYHGPIFFTGANGPETVSLSELHAARVRSAYDTARPPSKVYGIGDIIEIRTATGAETEVQVTARYGNVQPGRPGFNAVTPGGKVVVGFDRQVIRVVTRASD